MHRHPGLYVLTILIALASAVALLGAGLAMGSPRVSDPQLAASETVIRAFYDAVNQAIATGDTAALDGRVGDNLVTYGALAAIAPGRDGLFRYLETLHATQPQTELIVERVVSARDQALVHLAVRVDEEGSFLGSPLHGGSPPWGTVDSLAVAGHQVVEYWSGATGLTLLEAKIQAPVTLAVPAKRVVTLDRLLIPPGARFAAQGADDERMLIVETGSVAVTSSRLAIMPPPHQGPPVDTTGSDDDSGTGTPGSLTAGDLILLSSWSRTEVHNVGTKPASVLVLAASTPGVPGGWTSDPSRPDSQPPGDNGTGRPGWRAGLPQTSLSGAEVVPLAGGTLTALPAEKAVVAVGRMTMAPGAMHSSIEAAGPYLLVVEQGTLDLGISGERVWVRRADGGKSRVAAATLGDTNSALLHAGTTGHLSVRGEEPAVVTIVAILAADSMSVTDA